MRRDLVLHRLLVGFAKLRTLHAASRGPIYGTWIASELNRRGHALGAGAQYPLLHALRDAGLLEQDQQVVDGRVRKYYRITQRGEMALHEIRQRHLRLVVELIGEGG